MAYGLQEGSRQAAQRKLAEFAGTEPCYVAEFLLSSCRNAADDLGFIDGGDIGGPVAVGIGNFVIGTTEYVKQPFQPHFGSDLLACLADGRFCWGLPYFDGTAKDGPSVMMTGMLDQRHPASFTGR